MSVIQNQSCFHRSRQRGEGLSKQHKLDLRSTKILRVTESYSCRNLWSREGKKKRWPTAEGNLSLLDLFSFHSGLPSDLLSLRTLLVKYLCGQTKSGNRENFGEILNLFLPHVQIHLFINFQLLLLHFFSDLDL